MTLPLEQLHGKYEILSKIQEGGMGAIYKVRHLLLDEVRVIKVIRPQFADDEGLRQRFLHEARTAIRLRHANIAQLYDFATDESDGSSYMVMEFIDGVTVKQLLYRVGPPSIALAAEIAHQGLAALSYLHHHGYVHRDIAPDNLMVCRDFQGRALVKLIDLGIVKRLGADAALTRTGMFLGKVRYASPEQLDATVVSGEPDHRSDLYSYGVLLYELLTGHCPFPGESFSELVAAHLLKPPVDFTETDPAGRIPPELRRMIFSALEKRREDRPTSADEMAEALAPFRSWDDDQTRELRRALEATAVHTGGPEPPEPGSTQSRLDRQFRAEATPRPSTLLPDAPVPGAPPGWTEPPAAPADRPGPRPVAAATPAPAAPAMAAPAPPPSPPSLAEAELQVEETLAAGRTAAGRQRQDAGERPGGRKWVWIAAAVALLVAAGAVWIAASGGLPAGLSLGGEQPAAEASAVEEAAAGPGAALLPATAGTLVLDALPWAEVLEIRDAAGEIHPFGPENHTPLRLELPPGVYTLTLAHPRLAEPRQVTAAVSAGVTTRETVPLDPAEGAAEAFLASP